MKGLHKEPQAVKGKLTTHEEWDPGVIPFKASAKVLYAIGRIKMALSNICLTLHRPLLYSSSPELSLFPAGLSLSHWSGERCTCEPRVWQSRSYVFLVLRAVELGLLIPTPRLTGRDVLWTSSVSYFSTFCRTRPFIGSSGESK